VVHELFGLAVTREQRLPREEFDHDAPQAPHVDGAAVGKHSQNDLGRSIKAALDVRMRLVFGEATGAKVDHFDLVFAIEQDIFGFQVAVNDFGSSEVAQRVDNASGKASNPFFCKTTHPSFLKFAVKIASKQFEGDASVTSENKVFLHVNHIHSIQNVLFGQHIKNFDLELGLLMKPWLITNDFQSTVFFLLMIVHFHDIPKRTFTKKFNDLEPICDVVVPNHLVSTLFIVIPKISQRCVLCSALKLLCCRSNKPNFGIFLNFF